MYISFKFEIKKIKLFIYKVIVKSVVTKIITLNSIFLLLLQKFT